MIDAPTFFTLVITKTQTEIAELGHQYRATGKKDAKGDDIWDFTPSERAPKEVTREILRIVADKINIADITKLIYSVERY